MPRPRMLSVHRTGRGQALPLIYCHSLDLVTVIVECKYWKSDSSFYDIETATGNVPKLSQ
jgi:hypothetical protein